MEVIILIGGLVLAGAYFIYGLRSSSTKPVQTQSTRSWFRSGTKKTNTSRKKIDKNYRLLVNQVSGNHAKAERLIQYEMRKDSKLGRKEAIKEASTRIARDMH